MPTIGLDVLGERDRALQGKPRIKTWIWLQSCMDKRFNLDILFEKEPFEEKAIFIHKKVKAQK